MWNYRVRRRTAIVTLALAASSMCGCNRDHPQLPSSPASDTPVSPDPTPRDDPKTVLVWDDPEGARTITRVAAHADIAAELAAADAAYRFDPEHSFVIRDDARGGWVEVTFLALPSRESPRDLYKFVVDARCGDRRVAGALVVANRPLSGATWTDGVHWARALPIANPPDAEGRWSRRERDTFLYCLAERATVTVMTCSVACAWSGAVWAPCLLACVTSGTIGNIGGCLARVFLSRANAPEEREEPGR
jgi:hypothetical protein